MNFDLEEFHNRYRSRIIEEWISRLQASGEEYAQRPYEELYQTISEAFDADYYYIVHNDYGPINIFINKITKIRLETGFLLSAVQNAFEQYRIIVLPLLAQETTTDQYYQVIEKIKPKISSKEQVTIARLCVGVIMIISIIIAWNPNTPVAELSVIAFGTVAVTFFPLWGAYFWKRATTFGAVSATIVGAGLNIFFVIKGGKAMVLFPQDSLFQLNGFLFAFIVTGLVFFIGCLVTKPGTVEKKSLALFFHPSLSKSTIKKKVVPETTPEPA